MFETKDILCDCSMQFSSERWKKALHTIGAKRRMSSSYFPQSFGITEQAKQNLLTNQEF
jgi:hypothetical protein